MKEENVDYWTKLYHQACISYWASPNCPDRLEYIYEAARIFIEDLKKNQEFSPDKKGDKTDEGTDNK